MLDPVRLPVYTVVLPLYLQPGVPPVSRREEGGGTRGCINYEETTNDVPPPVFHITNNWDLHILNIRQQFSIHNREISFNVYC